MSARRTEFEALEVVTFPLPAADLNPGDTWPFDMPMSVAAERSAESVSAPRVQNASCPVTGRYLDRRVRDGRGEAVVELTGSVTPPPARRGRPANAGVSGIVSGAAVVDLATGWVTVAHVEADLDVGAPVRFDLEGMSVSGNARPESIWIFIYDEA